jgi:hypothetical protein
MFVCFEGEKVFHRWQGTQARHHCPQLPPLRLALHIHKKQQEANSVVPESQLGAIEDVPAHEEACHALASFSQAASQLTPLCPAFASPSPPAPSQQDPVCRLSLGGYTSTIDELDSVPASHSPSPAVVCSQYRLQQLGEGILSSRYPTPPAAPPKDDYISDSESEGEKQSALRQSPARVFRNGKIKVHKTYNGPVQLIYVGTGVYDGRSNDL